LVLFGSDTPEQTCVENGWILALPAIKCNPLCASRKSSLQLKQNGMKSANMARMRLEYDLDQAGKK
jgi:hypothetical protein